jgi:NAD(P)-dependent dehydrogenase (short-subunit alcohol dehydrogenase family)
LGADVSKEDDVRRMFHRTIGELGALDILVSNSGIQRDAPFEEMSLEQWDSVINTNLTGHFLCARGRSRIILPPKVERTMMLMKTIAQEVSRALWLVRFSGQVIFHRVEIFSQSNEKEQAMLH